MTGMDAVEKQGVLQRVAISAAAGISSIEQVTRLSVLNTSADLTWDQPASPLQHRPVRFLDRSAVLDDPTRDLLHIAACGGARGTRLAHMDRPRRQRSHGPDRPSRRRRGRAARGYRPRPMGCRPRADRTGHHVVAGGARAAFGRNRRARHLPGRGRAACPRPPHRRRATRREAELLIAREWAILADENDYTTDTFQQITGRTPRPITEFLHEHRTEFV
jgi:hypothetical protein